MVVALEPSEGIRVLEAYGNPEVKVVCNTRPIYPIGVICGEQTYPDLENIKTWIRELSQSAWFIDATDGALKLGNPILGNMIAVGALAATKVLPLDRAQFKAVLERKMSPDKVAVNLSAYDMGETMVRG